jgi:hypothetical protein
VRRYVPHHEGSIGQNNRVYAGCQPVRSMMTQQSGKTHQDKALSIRCYLRHRSGNQPVNAIWLEAELMALIEIRSRENGEAAIHIH